MALVDVFRTPPISADRSSITLLPPRTFVTPGVSAMRSKKLRELNGSSRMVRLSMTVPIAAVLVCNCGMVDCTWTLSATSPRDIITSTRVCEFTRSVMLDTVVVLNDWAEAVIR